MACWPKEDNLVGSNDKDLPRVNALLDRFAQLSTSEVRDAEMSTPVIFAPDNWLPFQDDSAWAKEQRLKCLEEQIRILDEWTPEKAIPPFIARWRSVTPGWLTSCSRHSR